MGLTRILGVKQRRGSQSNKYTLMMKKTFHTEGTPKEPYQMKNSTESNKNEEERKMKGTND